MSAKGRIIDPRVPTPLKRKHTLALDWQKIAYLKGNQKDTYSILIFAAFCASTPRVLAAMI
jgi:hypothetical protein